MQVEFYRALWGVDEEYETLFPRLQKEGFAGVEVSLASIGYPDTSKTQRFTTLRKKHSLKFLCGVYTAWDNYIGEWAPYSVSEHLQQFKTEIAAAKELGACHCNSHSGGDDLSDEEAIDFFKGAIAISKVMGMTVSHETHRGRILYSPWRTYKFLKQLPELRLTLDLSHWVIVSERHVLSPSSPHYKSLLDLVASRVDHIHSRCSTTQSSQIDDPSATEGWDALCRAEFDAVWEHVWTVQRGMGTKVITMDVEYGPPDVEDGGYQRNIVWEVDAGKLDGEIGTQVVYAKRPVKLLKNLVLEEKQRQEKLFYDWAAKYPNL
ncbi:hypothetical protein SeMB42_g06057 [Synchytrium endobioticum]|uniref:Xylose isomerase-like TIM barrel domain-containing protein n=1 Tax=Synchytrium endobioticum TaxID=286115 RepID=A0A507CKR6_9FUNG|nr:hypothetical protein SeMB42_g06057 [Synchytrium endobioticum]TPX44174.1 hypothetical protein SeLEV6574_g04652 [Synchytrium endobioticum]